MAGTTADAAGAEAKADATALSLLLLLLPPPLLVSAAGFDCTSWRDVRSRMAFWMVSMLFCRRSCARRSAVITSARSSFPDVSVSHWSKS